MQKLFKTGEKVLLICLSSVLALSVAATTFIGIKLFSDDSGVVSSEKTPTTVTVESIAKPDKDYSTVDFKDKISNGVLKIKDCGAKVDELIDNGPLIQAALRTVAQNPGTVLEFEKGTYYVGPKDKEVEHVFDISEFEADGVHLKGNGCTLMLIDNFVGCFNMRNCDNIVVENMYFDCLEAPWVQGTITTWDEKSLTMTLELDVESDLLEDPRMNDRMDTRYGMVRDKNNPYLMKAEPINFFFFTSYKKIRDGAYTVNMSPQSKYLVAPYVEVGDKIILSNRGGHSTFTFDLLGAGNVTLKDITIYNSAGGGVVGRQNKGDILLKNFKMMPRADSKNWVCGNADGVHIQGCEGSVTLEDCIFSNTSDDVMNLYQWYSDTTKVVSTDTIEVINNGTSFKKGTTIKIVDPVTGKLLGRPTIKEVEAVNGQRVDVAARLILDTAIPELEIGECKEKYLVYSEENDFKKSTIKNCTFQYIRGRALYLHSIDTVVENCTFKDISDHAIEGWYNGDEGFELQNLIVRNNKITNCAYLDGQADSETGGSISVHISTNSGDKQSTFISHDKILIENNEIIDYRGSAVNIGNSKNVTIKGNTFSVEKPLKEYKIDNAVFINYCENVEISNNTFKDARENITAAIRYDADTVKGITINDNKFSCAEAKQIVKD